MMSRTTGTVVRIGLVIGLAAGGFALLQRPTRLLETWLTVTIARLFGPHNFHIVAGTSVLELPHRGSAFLAVVTPSCSSAASITSLAGLGILVHRAGVGYGRRAIAVVAACALVFAGNIARLSAVLVVGLVAGRYSLVLVHDWVASMFSFAYTLGGFILMLYIVLGDGSSRARPELSPVAGVHHLQRSAAGG